jgi:hypothetical protein
VFLAALRLEPVDLLARCFDIPQFNRSNIRPATRLMKKGAALLHVYTRDRIHTSAGNQNQDNDRERRMGLLVRRLPQRIQRAVGWLRQPSSQWARIPAGGLLIVGGFLSVLPIFGLWMLPLGVVLLSEDVPPLRRGTDRSLAWIERRRPHWMGLPRNESTNTH